jgi:hypothetical protein
VNFIVHNNKNKNKNKNNLGLENFFFIFSQIFFLNMKQKEQNGKTEQQRHMK